MTFSDDFFLGGVRVRTISGKSVTGDGTQLFFRGYT